MLLCKQLNGEIISLFRTDYVYTVCLKLLKRLLVTRRTSKKKLVSTVQQYLRCIDDRLAATKGRLPCYSKNLRRSFKFVDRIWTVFTSLEPGVSKRCFSGGHVFQPPAIFHVHDLNVQHQLV